MSRFLFLAVCVAVAPLAAAQVLITEIMYNPDSYEGTFPTKDGPGQPMRTEWVEAHNTGETPVDISGWHLADEDGQTTGVPGGSTIAPGQTIVFIPADCEVKEFQQAWGEGFTVYQLGRWGREGLNNLGNSPAADKEILELRDAEGEVVDQVNYDDEGDWPRDTPDGPSIYLLPDGFDPAANDLPANWVRSVVGTHGARENKKTEHFSGTDTGSPGTVPTTVAEPDPVPMPADE